MDTVDEKSAVRLERESDEDEGERGQTGKKEESRKSAKPRRRRGGFHRLPGDRKMKEYPLTKTELYSLGAIGVSSGVFFSISTFLISYWLDLDREFAFAEKLKPEVAGYWHGIQTGCLWGGIATAVIAIGLTLLTLGNVNRIIRETDHDE